MFVNVKNLILVLCNTLSNWAHSQVTEKIKCCENTLRTQFVQEHLGLAYSSFYVSYTISWSWKNICLVSERTSLRKEESKFTPGTNIISFFKECS
jgi:hypothetical protein